MQQSIVGCSMLEDKASELRASMQDTLMRLLAQADTLADTLLSAKLAEVLAVLEKPIPR